jgi:DNA mismatch repair protein MutL
MPGIIQLLPDSIANQIAAGEVIQRPGSAVKELLENAIDSGATKIKLIVKDAGRTLIQVTDNGCGMNETDARLCFERHATSKIKTAADLFNLYTKGFRGEALASIAAIAQVELKTKRADDDLGTLLLVEGSEVVKQEPVSTANGTTISMKNLFYNVPARRNFLKTDQVELRHIIEEFQRVVLVHPDVEFSFSHNGDELFHLSVSNLRQRLVNFFGKSLNEKLVPVETETELAKIYGFVFKPEACKKVRGDQFFFVNNRFIKSPSLYHAINSSYSNIIATDHHPGFFIFIEVPPASLDVNIHPTKTEVKFENERDIYTILNAAVRQALGKHNMIPSIDFNRENEIEFNLLPKNSEVKVPTVKVDPNYNPFKSGGGSLIKPVKTEWETSSWVDQGRLMPSKDDLEPVITSNVIDKNQFTIPVFKIFGKYVIASFETKTLTINIRRAYERVYFEFLQTGQIATNNSQQLMFPETIQLSPVKFALYSDLKSDLVSHGFEINYAGDNTLNIAGVPTVIGSEVQAAQLLEQILDEADKSNNGLAINVVEIIQRKLAYNMSLSKAKTMNNAELQELVADLMQTSMPTHTPAGLNIFFSTSLDEIERKLG